MKLHLKCSVKAKVEQLIIEYGDNIDYIELTQWEYIQFLEEIGHIAIICMKELGTEKRTYRGTQIKVLR